jgi:hypothetical protein
LPARQFGKVKAKTKDAAQETEDYACARITEFVAQMRAELAARS